ncbi:MAG: DoxX family membrane protein [Chlamydiales bacterium]|nr:DoxX family membrane protein [Chlamydiales bacterium]
MKVLRVCSVVFARFSLSAAFLVSAMTHLFHWQETESILLAVLSEWQNYVSFSENFSYLFGSLTPWTSVILLVGTLLELLGSLLLLLGIREKLGAGLLFFLTALVTVIFHQFWFLDGGAREVQTSLFLKNLAIMGGLMMVILYGAKSSSREESGGPSHFM